MTLLRLDIILKWSLNFLTHFQSGEALGRQLEKIFHPERFDVKNLSSEAEGNVDTGAKFYHSSTDTPEVVTAIGFGKEEPVTMASAMGEMASAERTEEPRAFRPPVFQRSASFVEEPTTGKT